MFRFLEAQWGYMRSGSVAALWRIAQVRNQCALATYDTLQNPHKNDRILTLYTHEQVGKVN